LTLRQNQQPGNHSLLKLTDGIFSKGSVCANIRPVFIGGGLGNDSEATYVALGRFGLQEEKDCPPSLLASWVRTR
jgi:hypothetical protein